MDTRSSIAALEESLAQYGVKGTCDKYGLTYYRLQKLRQAEAIPSVASYPLQSMLLAACRDYEGGTLAALQTHLPPLYQYHHRQALWESCQRLVKKGLLRKTGTGLQARYWLPLPEGGSDGSVS